MQCNNIREMLSAHLDGVLEPSDHTMVTQHLGACPACRSEWEDLRMVVELVRELPEITPPAEFRHNLRKRIEAMPDHRSRIKKAALWPALTGSKISRVVAVAATVILTAGVTALWYGLPGQWGNKGADMVPSGKGTVVIGKKDESSNSSTIKGKADVEVLDARASDSFTTTASGSETRSNTEKTADRMTENQMTENRVQAGRGGQSLALKTPAPGLDAGADERMFDLAATENNSGITPESAAKNAPPGMGGGSGEMAGIAAVPSAARYGGTGKTIKQASMSIDVIDVDQVAQKVSSLVWSSGGMVAANNTAGGATMEIRVPAPRFDEVVERIQTMGTVVQKNITSKDVTTDFDNAVAGLAALESKEGTILEKNREAPAGVPAGGITATGSPEIKQLQMEREIRQNQLRELEDATVMATINVKLE